MHTHKKHTKDLGKPLTARNVTIWLIHYYSIARGNEPVVVLGYALLGGQL